MNRGQGKVGTGTWIWKKRTAFSSCEETEGIDESSRKVEGRVQLRTERESPDSLDEGGRRGR